MARCSSRSAAWAIECRSRRARSASWAIPAARCSSTSTTTCAKTRTRSTASSSGDERSCFEALLGAHGVGPALALAIMAVHAPLDLRRAVASRRCRRAVPRARRRQEDRGAAADRLEDAGSRCPISTSLHCRARRASTRAHPSSPTSATRSTGLGYGPDEVRDAMRDLEPGEDSAALLREALQRLASVRSHA